MKLLLTFLIFITCTAVISQPSDFFVLKKKDRTIKSYFKGSFINFRTQQGENFNGYIKKVQRDSVWVEYQFIRRSVTHIGSVILDTFVYNAKPFAVKDIELIVKDDQPSKLFPTVLQAGALGYTVLHVVNGLSQDGGIEASNLGIAAVVFITGTVWKKLLSSSYLIGRKYRIQYISVTE